MSYEPVDSSAEARVVEGLRALARSTEGHGASADVETRVMAAFDARHAGWYGRTREWGAWIAAAAAVVVLAGGLYVAQREIAPASGRDAGVAYATTEFVPWPGAAALPAFESGQLVRTELPASVLPLLGLTQADAPADGRVIADVLYAQDGLARAVRIVRNQSMNP